MMHLTDEPSNEFDDDLSDLRALQRPPLHALSARRSLERLLEQRALRSRLTDELHDSQQLDDMEW
ncbi:MAG: hypothetical protein EA347_12595 [Thioalkalivibrio sp.]|nr:MAG: hypothetical protein EA347_12595 [Thioalkalivibrio sp.]